MNEYNAMKGKGGDYIIKGDLKKIKTNFKETTNPNNSIPKKPSRLKGKED